MSTKDETQIRELLAEHSTAMWERDAERLVARYAPEIVKYDLAPPLRNSAPKDAGAVAKWFAGFDGPIEYEIRDLEVTIGGDVAFCHSLDRMSARPLGAPDKFDLWTRVTVGLRKVDGSWLITHEHTSTPFYMDGSFKAAVDLIP